MIQVKVADDLRELDRVPTAEPFHRCMDVIDGKGAKVVVPLTGDRALIGRAQDASIFLDDDGVSRRHAELYRDPFGRWWVRDLGSSNGTLVNGFRIDERLLELGDEIEIGKSKLVMTASDTVPSQEPAPLGSDMAVREARPQRISALEMAGEPTIRAAHLTTLMALAQRMQSIENVSERLRLLCSLMVSEQFYGRSATVIRLNREDASQPPRTLCSPQSSAEWRGQTLYVTNSLLDALRAKPQAMLASDTDPGSSSMAMAPTDRPEAAAASAMACPLGVTDKEIDVLYVMIPPSHGTMEWLTLMSLATDYFRQTESIWRIRRQARVNALVEHDLERGREIQMRLIPQDIEVEHLDIAVGFLPCRWVAGDYVDIIPTAKDASTLLVVADVCGKGLPAALVSSSVHTMVHACTRAGASLLGMVTLLNEHLFEHLPANRFVTGILTRLDPATGEMEFVNAGHPAPLVFDPDGRMRQLEVGHYEPLGLARVRYSLQTDVLETGQIMVMFTDGLTELKDQSGRMLTSERLGDHLASIIRSEPEAPVTQIADKLNETLDSYQGDRLQADDRTFLIVRRL